MTSSRRGFLAGVAAAVMGGPAALLAAPKPVTYDKLYAENLMFSDGSQEAMDAVNEFTRSKMREDGFMRRILPEVKHER